jgi:hypothetical protein
MAAGHLNFTLYSIHKSNTVYTRRTVVYIITLLSSTLNDIYSISYYFLTIILVHVVDDATFLELFVPFNVCFCSSMASSSSLALVNKLKFEDAPGFRVTPIVKPAIADELTLSLMHFPESM